MKTMKPPLYALLSLMLTALLLSSTTTAWAAESAPKAAKKQVKAVAPAPPKGAKKQVKTDERGKTINYVNKQKRIVYAVRQDSFGPELGRETIMVYKRDKQGKLLSRTSTNGLMTRVETYNSKGRVERAVQDDHFGVEWGRHRVFTNYKYDKQGNLVGNQESSKLETADHQYDKNERVVKSKLVRKAGLGAQRKTAITYVNDNKTGRPVKREEKNDYGTTLSTAFDPELWLPTKQKAKYNYGLGSTRENEIELTWDKKTGLPLSRVTTNKYGATKTFYDTSEEGTYGIPVGSEAAYDFGPEATRATRTVIKSSPLHGLTQATKAINEYETKWAVYDTFNEGLYGVPEKIETKRNFGLGVDRHTITKVKANTFSGLFINTKEYKQPDKKSIKTKPQTKPKPKSKPPARR